MKSICSICGKKIEIDEGEKPICDDCSKKTPDELQEEAEFN